jgi:hypothetical protein
MLTVSLWLMVSVSSLESSRGLLGDCGSGSQFVSGPWYLSPVWSQVGGYLVIEVLAHISLWLMVSVSSLESSRGLLGDYSYGSQLVSGSWYLPPVWSQVGG